MANPYRETSASLSATREIKEKYKNILSKQSLKNVSKIEANIKALQKEWLSKPFSHEHTQTMKDAIVAKQSAIAQIIKAAQEAKAKANENAAEAADAREAAEAGARENSRKTTLSKVRSQMANTRERFTTSGIKSNSIESRLKRAAELLNGANTKGVNDYTYIDNAGRAESLLANANAELKQLKAKLPTLTTATNNPNPYITNKHLGGGRRKRSTKKRKSTRRQTRRR